MMQAIKREEDLADYTEDCEMKGDYKIADVLLGNIPDHPMEAGEELIEYEIKFDLPQKNKLRNKCGNLSKKGKKYQMHPPELKRECVELVKIKKINFFLFF
jgi:hypothetical protein